MSESSDAGRARGAPAPSPQLQRLDALAGRWRSEGHIVGEVPVSITEPISTNGLLAASSWSTTST